MDSDHKKEILDKLVKCEDIENAEDHYNHLREMGDYFSKDPNFNELYKFLNAVANKKRLLILHFIKEKDRCVCELEALLDDSQPSVSHHLKILENAGLVRGWKKGKFTHYEVVGNLSKIYTDLLFQKSA
ncbi:MAG: ArsR/SmtB family transcription factor [Promethearchaeota archaeon]|jgi:ArsR family transcriptional regulator